MVWSHNCRYKDARKPVHPKVMHWRRQKKNSIGIVLRYRPFTRHVQTGCAGAVRCATHRVMMSPPATSAVRLHPSCSGETITYTPWCVRILEPSSQFTVLTHSLELFVFLDSPGLPLKLGEQMLSAGSGGSCKRRLFFFFYSEAVYG